MFVNMCSTQTILALASLILIYSLMTCSRKEGFAEVESEEKAAPETVKKAVVPGVPVTPSLCMDYQMVHSTPGMAEWCRNIGTVTNWM